MKFVYDLMLNYSDVDNFYDFYEWSKSDTLNYVEKIPAFKVNSEVFDEIDFNVAKIDYDFLSIIKNKTVLENKKILYSFLICDNYKARAFLCDNCGVVLKKSSLLLDEETSVLDEMEEEELTTISYNIVRKIDSKEFLTRKEKEIKTCLLNEINLLYTNGYYDEIDYLYNEVCSEKKNIESKYEYLINNISNNVTKYFDKLYDIVRLVQ